MFPVELHVSAAASEIIFPLSALEHYKEDFAMLTRCFFRCIRYGMCMYSNCILCQLP